MGPTRKENPAKSRKTTPRNSQRNWRRYSKRRRGLMRRKLARFVWIDQKPSSLTAVTPPAPNAASKCVFATPAENPLLRKSNSTSNIIPAENPLPRKSNLTRDNTEKNSRKLLAPLHKTNPPEFPNSSSNVFPAEN